MSAISPVNALSCVQDNSYAWMFANVSRIRLRNSSLTTQIELVDTKTGDRYRADSIVEVGAKCFALLIYNPIRFSVSFFWHLAKIPADITKIGIESIQAVGRSFQQREYCKGLGKGFRGIVWEIPKQVIRDIFQIVRIPLYAVGMELSALVGVVSPYEGRKLFASLERSWNHGRSHHRDILKLSEGDDFYEPSLLAKNIAKAFLDRTNSYTYYSAYCFQPLGNVRDRNITNVHYI